MKTIISQFIFPQHPMTPMKIGGICFKTVKQVIFKLLKQILILSTPCMMISEWVKKNNSSNADRKLQSGIYNSFEILDSSKLNTLIPELHQM